MLTGFTLLLLFQLAGEIVVRGLGLPIPGPVMGMFLLFAALLLCGRLPASVRSASEGLLRYLAVLFVPAGVGLIAQKELLAREWPGLTVSLVISTALTLAVTGLAFQALRRRQRHAATEAGE
jgi:holin-like protein